MAKRTTEKGVATTEEIPPDVIGAVILADLAQIKADSATHQDPFARDRLLKAVNRLLQIVEGDSGAAVIEQDELAAA